MHVFNKVQIVLKVAERCNLNCSYCYYFNGYEEAYIDKPPFMTSGVVKKLTNDIINLIENGHVIKNLEIFIHGGEPTLMKYEKLDSMIDYLQSNLSHRTNVSFFMQTNGTLITSNVIKLINKYKISVGISIDGNEIIHDKHRIYRSGRGSFKDVKDGILKLKSNIKENVPSIGILAVATKPEHMGDTYKLIVDELGVSNISFLYPEKNYDELTGQAEISDNPISSGMINCFDMWKENTDVNFNNVVSFTRFFQNVNVINYEIAKFNEYTFIQSRLFMLRSDGELYYYDRFLPESADKVITGEESKNVNIFDTDLFEYLTSKPFKFIDNLYKKLPSECNNCLYRNVCRGGNIENRYSYMNGFYQKSIYCEDIKKFYDYICSELEGAGYPSSKIYDKLLNNLAVK
ncbi:radical SAM protein [Vibrio parahaemolyticus]|nr:radical SAM protein [Vibrio parahaemolyticus]